MKYTRQILRVVTVLGLALVTFTSTSFAQEFPSLVELQMSNISIQVEAIHFPAGLDAKGNLTGDGLSTVLVGGAGSGFIVGSDGTIVTNYHVIKGAQRAVAIFDDGSKYDINHIKVYDSIADLAVLKIASKKAFPTVRLGDSDRVNLMDEVLAVGNTLGRGMAISKGIITRINVDEKTNQRISLEHDAKMAPGNSGGALYHGKEIIGVNVALQLPYLLYYAVPINFVKPLLRDYPTEHYLPDVFSQEVIFDKATQLAGTTDKIEKRISDKEPSYWSTTYQFYPLTDYIIHVNSPDRDLTLALIDDEGNVIGFGAMEEIGNEGILFSSEYYQEITISVLNFGSKSAKFGLDIYRIDW